MRLPAGTAVYATPGGTRWAAVREDIDATIVDVPGVPAEYVTVAEIEGISGLVSGLERRFGHGRATPTSEASIRAAHHAFVRASDLTRR